MTTFEVTWYNPRERVRGSLTARDEEHAKRLVSDLESLGHTSVTYFLRPEALTVGRRSLVVTYDVTGLTAEQIDHLTLEAVVQAEDSYGNTPEEGHPDVPVTSVLMDEGEDDGERTFLAHVNLTLPWSIVAPYGDEALARQLRQEIRGALEVGREGAPLLSECEINLVAGEEI